MVNLCRILLPRLSPTWQRQRVSRAQIFVATVARSYARSLLFTPLRKQPHPKLVEVYLSPIWHSTPTDGNLI